MKRVLTGKSRNEHNFLKAVKKVLTGSFYNLYADSDNAGGESDVPGTDSDGADDGGTDNNNNPSINIEDLLTKIRKQERKKQQKTIDSLKKKIETYVKQHNEDLLKIAGLEKKLEEQPGSDNEEINRLKGELSALEKDKKKVVKELEDLKNETVPRDELETQIREELEKTYEVKTYKAEQLAAHKEDILVPELVMGETKEEIDSSIQAAIERSNQIKSNLGYTNNMQPPKRLPKGGSPGISGIQGNPEYTVDYIANLDPRSKEYAEFRAKIGLR